MQIVMMYFIRPKPTYVEFIYTIWNYIIYIIILYGSSTGHIEGFLNQSIIHVQ